MAWDSVPHWLHPQRFLEPTYSAATRVIGTRTFNPSFFVFADFDAETLGATMSDCLLNLKSCNEQGKGYLGIPLALLIAIFLVTPPPQQRPVPASDPHAYDAVCRLPFLKAGQSLQSPAIFRLQAACGALAQPQLYARTTHR